MPDAGRTRGRGWKKAFGSLPFLFQIAVEGDHVLVDLIGAACAALYPDLNGHILSGQSVFHRRLHGL